LVSNFIFLILLQIYQFDAIFKKIAADILIFNCGRIFFAEGVSSDYQSFVRTQTTAEESIAGILPAPRKT
jgi:hypothetical protein